MRVAFAGDSVTLGLMVEREETFSKVFEQQANRSKPARPVLAMNFAVDGYGALQVAEMIRTKVLPFEPDQVVYVMCLNDFDFDQSSGDKALYFRKPTSFFLLALENAFIKATSIDFHLVQFWKHRREVFGAIIDLDAQLSETEVGYQVVIVPIFFREGFEDYPLRGMHAEIDEVLSQAGIKHLDLLDFFERPSMAQEEIAVDLLHLSPSGHRWMASWLIPFVLGSSTSVDRDGAARELR